MYIRSRNHLHFYLQADMMMNRGYFKEPLKMKLLHLVAPDYIMEFLKIMRKVQYYSQCKFPGGGILLIINKLLFLDCLVNLDSVSDIMLAITDWSFLTMEPSLWETLIR